MVSGVLSMMALVLCALGALCANALTTRERRDRMHAAGSPDNPFQSSITLHPFTIDEYGFAPNSDRAEPLPASTVTPIVMTGSCCRDRARTLMAAWGSRFAALVFVSDEADPGTGAVTLPELEGKPTC